MIHTEGDLTHFIRTITTIAVSAAFATIAEPMIRKRILSSEELRIVLQRAAMNEEIADGEISVQDIQQILLNEYSLKVINVSGQCSLGGVENAKPTMWNLQMYIKVIGLNSTSIGQGISLQYCVSPFNSCRILPQILTGWCEEILF